MFKPAGIPQQLDANTNQSSVRLPSTHVLFFLHSSAGPMEMFRHMAPELVQESFSGPISMLIVPHGGSSFTWRKPYDFLNHNKFHGKFSGLKRSSKKFVNSVFNIESNTHLLVSGGWTNPISKNMIVKLDHFPRDRGEHTKIFESTT